MNPWIKICGLTSEDAVAAAVAVGVDATGFVFHARSPRNLTPAAAARLARDVPRGILKVAVTRHPSQALVDEILREFRPDVLQTDAEDLAVLDLPADLQILPVLRTGGEQPRDLPTWCVYESAESGQGIAADWHEAAEIARRTQLILAGGLDPTNVAAALSAVRSFGVDVSSGVEDAPGRKNVMKMLDFVAAARAAATQPVRGLRE
jgi:phosphoribosylanthranilate isomerase